MATNPTPATEIKCFTKKGFDPKIFSNNFFAETHTLYAEEGNEIQALLKVLEDGKRRDAQLEILSIKRVENPLYDKHYDVYFKCTGSMLFSLGYDWRAMIDHLNRMQEVEISLGRKVRVRK